MYAVGDGLGAFASGDDLEFDDAVGGAGSSCPTPPMRGWWATTGAFCWDNSRRKQLDVLLNLQYQAQGTIARGRRHAQPRRAEHVDRRHRRRMSSRLGRNGAIDVNDLLMFIAQFGNACD